jgi:hypothetical protein
MLWFWYRFGWWNWWQDSIDNRKKAGVGGTIAGIAVVVVATSLWMVNLFGIILGILAFAIGIILMPGMKKDPQALREEEQGYAVRECPKCRLELKYDFVTQTYEPCQLCGLQKPCPTCGTILIRDEASGGYNCPYCHVGFGEGDLPM